MLEAKAQAIRETIVEMLLAAGSGHIASPLGLADIYAALYFHILNQRPSEPEWQGRDRLFMSNGHTAPVRYAAMAHAGYFPLEECLTLRKFGSRLQGHPERLRLAGLESTSGPLGEGLSQAAGYAYAARTDPFHIFCIMGDGEQDEGNVWEAAMFAGANHLGNLIAIIDRNHIQIDGTTEDVLPLENLRAKYEAFNWQVFEVDGNDVRAFVDVVEQAKEVADKPTLILAHTIPGKGVPEIERDYHYHGYPKSKEETQTFLNELRTMGGKIRSEHQ